jgi:hypothetical protein
MRRKRGTKLLDMYIAAIYNNESWTTFFAVLKAFNGMTVIAIKTLLNSMSKIGSVNRYSLTARLLFSMTRVTQQLKSDGQPLGRQIQTVYL